MGMCACVWGGDWSFLARGKWSWPDGHGAGGRPPSCFNPLIACQPLISPSRRTRSSLRCKSFLFLRYTRHFHKLIPGSKEGGREGRRKAPRVGEFFIIQELEARVSLFQQILTGTRLCWDRGTLG